MCNIISRVAYCRQVRASRSPTQRPTPRIRTRYYHYQYRISYLPLSATIDYYRYRLPLLLLPLLPLLLPLLLPIVLRLLLNEPNEQRVSSRRRDLARWGTWTNHFTKHIFFAFSVSYLLSYIYSSFFPNYDHFALLFLVSSIVYFFLLIFLRQFFVPSSLIKVSLYSIILYSSYCLTLALLLTYTFFSLFFLLLIT